MKRLEDGEQRTMKHGPSSDRNVEIVAHRVDCDTPYIKLTAGQGTVMLTDVGAEELIDRLRRALSMLPTSK